MKTWAYTILFLLGALNATHLALADTVPCALNYQGGLRSKTKKELINRPQGYTMIFAIYEDEEGGDPLWASMRRVVVKNSYFDVVLADGSGSLPTGGGNTHTSCQVRAILVSL